MSILHAAERDARAEHAADSASTRFSASSSRRSRADAGAERGAHHQLVLAPHAAHQREVRDVGAGDDQHERRRAHEQPEREPRLLPSTSWNGVTVTW